MEFDFNFIPDPEEFKILVDNKEIHILSYEKIIIDFSEHIKFVNGKRELKASPSFSYIVKLSANRQKDLLPLFKNCENKDIVSTRATNILIGRNIFLGLITAIPVLLEYGNQYPGGSYKLYHNWKTKYAENTVRIDLENSDNPLKLEDVQKEVEKSLVMNRFEILDL